MPFDQLPLLPLAAKLCFLLGLTGFLGAGIYTIDRDDSYVDNVTGILHLHIVKPKEKRQGQFITKWVSICPFNHDPQLYPVKTCVEYCARTHEPCQRPYPPFSNRPKDAFTPLIGNATNAALDVSPDTSAISSVSSLDHLTSRNR